jgi:hypothetical protein
MILAGVTTEPKHGRGRSLRRSASEPLDTVSQNDRVMKRKNHVVAAALQKHETDSGCVPSSPEGRATKD